jgi:hypothetical protein
MHKEDQSTRDSETDIAGEPRQGAAPRDGGKEPKKQSLPTLPIACQFMWNAPSKNGFELIEGWTILSEDIVVKFETKSVMLQRHQHVAFVVIRRPCGEEFEIADQCA